MKVGDVVVPSIGEMAGVPMRIVSYGYIPEWNGYYFGVYTLDDEDRIVDRYFSREYLDNVWLEADAL